MRRILLLGILLTGLLVSCYKIYNTDINTNKKVLVVNGLITNERTSYHILVSYASPFDSGSMGKPVSLAQVYVTDNLGNNYYLSEKSNGEYVSDSVEFTALPGNTYTLHIITPDGEEYASDQQHLLPEAYPDSVYTQFDYQEVLDRSTGLKVVKKGANILSDIMNQADTLPRFRFTSNITVQYFYKICPLMQPCVLFYCWQSEEANLNINLTGGEYAVDSASIRRHPVCFIEDNDLCFALTYDYASQGPDLPYLAIETRQYQFYEVHNRLIYLNLYTLNSEAYQFYKSMDKQLRAEGKLFDPIAVQLMGNIKCISNPSKKAFGFFEASAVSHVEYKIDFRHLSNAQPSLIRVPYILPDESNGCYVNSIPPFWVSL